MRSFVFKDLEVFHITKRTLKNSYIQIDPHAKILLKTPHVSQTFLLELLESKEHWIRNKLSLVQNTPLKKARLEDEVLLFGETIGIDSPDAHKLRTSLASIPTQEKKRVLRAYELFYEQHANEYLPRRLEHFAALMGLSYKELRIKKLKSRWGSCDSLRRITLNRELIKIEKELIDYVVVHELAHLVHMNHSKEFHALVAHYLPQARPLRKRLKAISLHNLSFDD